MKEMSRFDTRLSKEQKELFEEASRLGGFKTLSDFILSSAQEHATQIIERHQQILLTVQDREVFFNALLKPKKPNTALKKAAEKYRQATSRK